MSRLNDQILYFFNGLTSRVVAKSGKPKDRWHIGKLILQGLQDAPEFILQIDGATNLAETFGSVLERSIHCATSFRNFGLKTEDVIVLLAPNSNDLTIPLYAALYLGIRVAPMDRKLGVYELKAAFKLTEPKLVFCQSEKFSDVRTALDTEKQTTHVITFDKNNECLSFEEFVKKYKDDTTIENFKPSDFDTEETISILLPTSGTIGIQKCAALTQKYFSCCLPYVFCMFEEFPTPTRLAFVISPPQWLAAIFFYLMGPILRFTRLQSSSEITIEHSYDLINRYRPTIAIVSPPFLTSLLRSEDNERCDITSFEVLLIGGSAVTPELITELKMVSPNTLPVCAYGMTEAGILHFNPDGRLSMGMVPKGLNKFRLIDTDTGKDINEPNVAGELWLKGPHVFKGYYKDSEATKEVFTEDGWFRTGDILYRDVHHNYYFVDRLKMLLKYKNHQISPAEIEAVIACHPEVLLVAVTGMPDPSCGELPVACVVRKPGSNVSAQEIKDLVKETLTDTKHLRGGVIFMESLPMTATTKIDRKKLKQIVLNMPTE